MRMFSVCTYNFWNGTANACVIDEGVAADENGDYTLVVSDGTHRPANARAEQGVTWLDSGPFLDGQLTFRMLLEEQLLLRGLRRALDGGQPSPEVAGFVPRSAFCSRRTFEESGFDGCLDAWQQRKARG